MKKPQIRPDSVVCLQRSCKIQLKVVLPPSLKTDAVVQIWTRNGNNEIQELVKYVEVDYVMLQLSISRLVQLLVYFDDLFMQALELKTYIESFEYITWTMIIFKKNDEGPLKKNLI
jgi:hypothetical protein